MKLGAWFRKFFGGAAVSPADLSKLSATNEATLALSIRNLQRGERGWISLPEAAHLFSNKETAVCVRRIGRRRQASSQRFRSKIQLRDPIRTYRSTSVFPAAVELINKGRTALKGPPE
jgi:hypothetical protein